MSEDEDRGQQFERLRIGIVDADLLDNGTRHPNLALMKIGGYLREKGHQYKLLYTDELLSGLDNYDMLIVSKVFTFTKVPPQLLLHISGKNEWNKHNLSVVDEIHRCSSDSDRRELRVLVGGTGFFPDGGMCLDEEIEHQMPDYDLYKEYVEHMISQGRNRAFFSDYVDYSIGFTTRGCFRKCDFCVNKKYDRAQRHSPIKEFLDYSRPMIYLWDDNFFALFNGWEDILDELEATGKPFQFRQGLDIRLMTPRHAEKLSKCRYHGDFIFAFDHIEDKNKIREKLELWRRYTRRTTKLYVLCAFDSWNSWDGKSDITPLEQRDVENTFERIKILMEYGCLPYIMRYETYKNSRYRGLYTQLARWCNQPQFFKKKSFRQFCQANQEYSKNQESVCSAYQSMLDFERECPDIARKYFDLRFDQLNMYQSKSSYAHGESRPCVFCKGEQITWDDVHNKKASSYEAVEAYLLGKLDFICLDEDLRQECSTKTSVLASDIIAALGEVKIGDILRMIDDAEKLREVEVSTIPQFSDLDDATDRLLELLGGGSEMTYLEIGTRLDDGKLKSDVAKRKYGENHAKLASLLDLARVNDSAGGKAISITPVGGQLLKLDHGDRKEIIQRLFFRIPVIQHLFQKAKEGDVFVSRLLEMTMMKDSTVGRRRASIISIVKEIEKSSDPLVYDRVSKIN